MIFVPVVPCLDGSPSELIGVSFFVNKGHSGYIVDTLIACPAWSDINRSKDFHFEIDRWSLHEKCSSERVLESEIGERAANLGRPGEQLHDRDALLALLGGFELPRYADNLAARDSPLSRRSVSIPPPETNFSVQSLESTSGNNETQRSIREEWVRTARRFKSRRFERSPRRRRWERGGAFEMLFRDGPV